MDLDQPAHDTALQRITWRRFLVRVHGLAGNPRAGLFTALAPDPPKPTGGTA